MKQHKGLTSQEVQESFAKYGNNRLSIKESATLLEMFIESFKDKWILILLAALGIKVLFNFIIILVPKLGEADWYDVVSIALAILLSTGFATISSYRSEQKFNALQDEASKTLVKVYRDGHITEILVDDIVIGDEILIQTGDKVPADGYILEGHCKVNQASLNGESEDADKVELGEQELPESNDLFSELKLFRGTVLTSGEVVMKATVIGDNTVLGSINTSLQEENKQSPSKEKLERLANGIGVMGYSAGSIYFIINITLGFLAWQKAGGGFSELFLIFMQTLMFSVTIVIMAVPEGLPMMLAMVASMNSGKLLREKILVRHPDSIETAGYTNVLFSDKTGTITQGVLSVVDFIDGEGKIYQSLNETSDSLKNTFIEAIGLNNDAMVSENKAIGSNGTDRALLQYLIDNNFLNFDREKITDKEQFNSTNKYASVSIGNLTYLKGAAEVLLKQCSHYLKDNKYEVLTPQLVDNLNEISLAQAARSMRLLAICLKENNQQVLIGLVCIRDNLREGMYDTIKILNNAQVQVVMVTGDRKETAVAIAKEAGIIKSEEDVVLTHDELEALSDKELIEIIPHLKVVSRALPMDKKRLVNIAQQLNMVCGMTGDGTNDSPALKSSDIGYSMGDGSQTAQEASDIVILNNSLSSIEKAILNGRTMTKSVQKFIIFQLTVNVATILISIIGPLFGFKEPFTIVQILWVNLIMDTLAALAFGEEPSLQEYMNERPIGRKENIVTTYMKTHIGTAALFITLGVLGIYLNVGDLKDLILEGVAENLKEQTIRTFIFTFFIYAIIFNSLNTRTTGINVFSHILENKKFIIVMGSIAIAQSLIIQYGGKVFSTVAMDFKHFVLALIFAVLIIPIDFFRKAMVNKKPH